MAESKDQVAEAQAVVDEAEEEVFVPAGDNAGDTATLLLAAAEHVGVDQSVVRFAPIGGDKDEPGFYVPRQVEQKSHLKTVASKADKAKED